VSRKPPWREISEREAVTFIVRPQLSIGWRVGLASAAPLANVVAHEFLHRGATLAVATAAGALACAVAWTVPRARLRIDRNLLILSTGVRRRQLARIAMLDIEDFAEDRIGAGNWSLFVVLHNGTKESLQLYFSRQEHAIAFAACLRAAIVRVRMPEGYRE
jgi:hypothetical protein